MELTISKKCEYYDCMDSLIATVAEYWNLDYEMMFKDVWNFKFEKKETEGLKKIGNLFSDNTSTDYQALIDYHCLKIKFTKIHDFNWFIKELTLQLQHGNPVAVLVDKFWCPWMKIEYQKIHRKHYCLVVGISENHELKVIESQIADGASYLPLSNFEKCFDDYVTFQRTSEEHAVQFDWKQEIISKVKELNQKRQGYTIFEEIRELSNRIKRQFELEVEVEGFEKIPYKSRFYQCLYNVGRRRMQYADYLQYIARKYNEVKLIQISDEFRLIGNQWMSTFGIMCKAFYTKNNSHLINMVADKIFDIACKEESIHKKLMDIYVSNSYYVSDGSGRCNDHVGTHISNFEFVDLSQHYNNNGVSSSLDYKDNSEFSNGGRYYNLECFPLSHIYDVGNMRFRLPLFSNDSLDNVVCSGQVIRLQTESPKHLMFLGASEYGSHIESVKVSYKDGQIIELPLEMTNWCKFPSKFKEILAWESQVLERSNNKVEAFFSRGYVYAKNYALDIEGTVTSIILPKCPNIHLFAISFGT